MNIIISKIETVNYLDKIGKLERNQKEDVLKKIENLENVWQDNQNKLSYFIEHDELEKVTKCLIVLEENFENEEYANSLEDCKEFIYWLEHFKEKDSLKLKNIF